MVIYHKNLDVYRRALEFVETHAKAEVLLERIIGMLTKLVNRHNSSPTEIGSRRREREPLR